MRRLILLAGVTGLLAATGWGLRAAPVAAKPATFSEGQYSQAHWRIDENRVLWWDGKPCIPMTVNQIWIDNDKFSKGQFSAHFKSVNDLTDQLTKNGETYFVLFVTHPPVKSLADLKNATVRTQFETEWKRFAPAVTKAGLRGMTFFNEINVLAAPKSMTDADYAKLLNDYARSMKQIVADVPVVLKIAGDWNIGPTMAAIRGDYIDGLGGDFFSDLPDQKLTAQMAKPLAELAKASKSKLFWVTEFSRQTGQEPKIQWPAFTSKQQMQDFLDLFVKHGATGFFYFKEKKGSNAWQGPGGYAQVTTDTARWFRELAPVVTNRVLSGGNGTIPTAMQTTPTAGTEGAEGGGEGGGGASEGRGAGVGREGGGREGGGTEGRGRRGGEGGGERGGRLGREGGRGGEAVGTEGAEGGATAAQTQAQMKSADVVATIENDTDIKQGLLARYPGYTLDATYVSQFKVWEVRVLDAGTARALIYVRDQDGKITEIEKNIRRSGARETNLRGE